MPIKLSLSLSGVSSLDLATLSPKPFGHVCTSFFFSIIRKSWKIQNNKKEAGISSRATFILVQCNGNRDLKCERNRGHTSANKPRCPILFELCRPIIASAGFTNQKNFLKTLKAAIENFRYAQSNIVGVLLNVIMSLLSAMFPRCSCN